MGGWVVGVETDFSVQPPKLNNNSTIFFNPSLNKVKIKKTHASVPNTMMLEALRKDD